MSYCTLEKLVSRFGEAELLRIADRDNDNEVDVEVVQGALNDASDEIDAYIGTRYTVPMNPIPSLLDRLCADIARYRLYDENPLEEVDNRYKQAVATLRDISSGKASLKDPQAAVAPAGDVLVTHTDEHRLFTMESMRGF